MQKFSMPKDMWLKFGCFLSGHNYSLLAECSETSKKYVRKLTSALLIITIIWSMIGYMFATRYTDAGIFGGVIGAIFAGVIIIQIERQIILGSTKNVFWTLLFRLLLGLIVAIIGALILDQVFFKNDIQKKKEDLIEERINTRTAKLDSIYNKNIAEIDSNILSVNYKIANNDKLIKTTGALVNTGSQVSIDTAGTKTFTSSKGTNPLLVDNTNKSQQVNDLRNKKIEIQKEYLFNREKVKEDTRKEKPGFLDELNIIYKLASESFLSAFAYFIFLAFFILIELFIVLAKISDGHNDYYKIIAYQEKIREERLKILEQKRSAALGENDRIDLSNELISNLPK